MVVNETQSFRGSIIMFGMIMLEIPTLVLLIVLWQKGKLGEDGLPAVLFVGAIIVVTFLFLMSIKLELRMDDKSISFRNPPLKNKWQKIPFNEIDSIQVKKMDGLLEYGGIGVRYSRSVKAYIFFSDHVVEVKLPKKKLVFSTRKHHEIKEMVAVWNENGFVNEN
ncbi:hypothetical protein MMU07_15905 [Aquiflexum sp. LQ15W]|uniref:hypothetical protein n=1 Tax=Cognataquiflexum nitidum TaxID=2922272 RepID=UPI001F13FC06|nr:hypothetical protein [Cognataquiflexum nitidum]MCH6201071.1 hypothetical protein [Cognataquiflexum nitidum]